jgi:peptide-methionine (S)-S-oxide reductase
MRKLSLILRLGDQDMTTMQPPSMRILKPYAASALCFSILVTAFLLRVPSSGFAETAFMVPPPTISQSKVADVTTEKAVLAGGCFWGVQGVFQHVAGVKNAVSGYAGGTEESAR